MDNLDFAYLERKKNQVLEFKEYLKTQFYDENEINNIIKIVISEDIKSVEKIFNKYNFDNKFKLYFLPEPETIYYYNILQKNKNNIPENIYEHIEGFFTNNDGYEINIMLLLELLLIKEDVDEILELVGYVYNNTESL